MFMYLKENSWKELGISVVGLSNIKRVKEKVYLNVTLLLTGT